VAVLDSDARTLSRVLEPLNIAAISGHYTPEPPTFVPPPPARTCADLSRERHAVAARDYPDAWIDPPSASYIDTRITQR
jgi:hypothetical protein